MLPDRATKGERSMSEKWYLATLTTEEEKLLCDTMNRGKHGAWKRRWAQALLCAHEGCTDIMTAKWTGTQRRSVGALRQRFVEEGFETTLEGKPRGRRLRALAGEDEAWLTALVYRPDPESGACWTVRL
jgi:hypothetical protein